MKKTPMKLEKPVAINEQDLSPEAMIARAIDKGLPVETMERILAMGREIRSERAKAEYDQAMAKFQAECPTIVKTKEVKTRAGIIAYRYAPIESIVEQTKTLLQKHGFSYSTSMELLADGVRVVVRVTHEAGHSQESPMQVPFGNKTDMMSQSQVTAAATTFAKRYAFCNAFGIMTGDEDTDARPDASLPPYQSKTPQNAKLSVTAHTQQTTQAYATPQQIRTITTLLGELATSQATIEKQIGKPLVQLTLEGAKKVIADLERIKDERIAKNEGGVTTETVVCKMCEQAVDITEYNMEEDMCALCLHKRNNTFVN